jgi:hypothetical protein
VTDSGSALRTPVAGVNGSDATLTRRVRIGFDIDTTNTYGGCPADVVLRKNVGAGWVTVATKHYNAGQLLKDQYFEQFMVVPAGTRFELKLSLPVIFPATGGFSITTARKAMLTVHSSTDTVPGCEVMTLPATHISVGFEDDVWPEGMQVNLTLDGVSFSYTLPSDKTTTQIHTALQALIDAHASFVATYTPPSTTGHGKKLDFIQVSKTAGGGVTVSLAANQFPAIVHMWNPKLSMTPDEHVGRTLRNLTDGSEGTIVSNSETAFEVDALTGGTSNIFNYGDNCVVVDDGSAYYVFQEAPWGQRLVGDDTLSPFPSFTERQINEVFFHAGQARVHRRQPRVLSATGDLYRFFSSDCHGAARR